MIFLLHSAFIFLLFCLFDCLSTVFFSQLAFTGLHLVNLPFILITAADKLGELLFWSIYMEHNFVNIHILLFPTNSCHSRSNTQCSYIILNCNHLPHAEANGQQSANTWKGVFSVSSYTQYFNVDEDIVMNRLMSSLNPLSGDFFSKIDANPDL